MSVTPVEPLLTPIRKRAKAYAEHGTPGLAAPRDRAALLAAVQSVLELCEEWDFDGQQAEQLRGPYGYPNAAGAREAHARAVGATRIRDAITAALEGSGE